MRGEIWTVAGGVYASRPRPALVIQDDIFDGTDSLTVVPMTSDDGTSDELLLIRLPVAASRVNGLKALSWVMIDKITTIKRARAERFVGRVTASQLVEVERLIMVFLGLAR